VIAVTSRKAIRNLAVGEFVCRASADHPSADGYHRRFSGVVPKKRGRKGTKKPLGSMNDIIEFHAALIPVLIRITRN